GFLFEENLIVRNFNSYKTERKIYLSLPTNMFNKAYKLIDSVSSFDKVILNLDGDNYTKEYMNDSIAIYSTATKKISLQNGNTGPVDLLLDNERLHKASQSEIYFIEFLKMDNEINVIVSAFPNISDYAHKRKLFFEINLPQQIRNIIK
ncbi:MAG: hypothetical protein SFU21_12345, partial [Flavihumibacter sp.]|nr:hypothetical protein [Flavihumibacter sp.]